MHFGKSLRHVDLGKAIIRRSHLPARHCSRTSRWACAAGSHSSRRFAVNIQPVGTLPWRGMPTALAHSSKHRRVRRRSMQRLPSSAATWMLMQPRSPRTTAPWQRAKRRQWTRVSLLWWSLNSRSCCSAHQLLKIPPRPPRAWRARTSSGLRTMDRWICREAS